jgi:hypothetical protein
MDKRKKEIAEMNSQYEVLSPWAEADPIPLKGLTAPRVTDLASKKIGLLINDKRAAPPVRAVVERKLKERFPTLKTSWYDAKGPVLQGKVVPEYEAWLKTVDAVVLFVGD